MNERIETMLSDAQGSYLEATEQSALIDYAASLEDRLRSMRAVQQHESSIVEATMDALWEEHPDMKLKHVDAYQKGTRDMTLVLRYSAMAMIRDCPQYLDQKMLHWFRTIIQAFEMEAPLQFAYAELQRQTAAHLDEDDISYLMPFLVQCQEILAPVQEESAAE